MPASIRFHMGTKKRGGHLVAQPMNLPPLNHPNRRMKMANVRLWCCHVIGPDDVTACESKEAAQKMADETNAFLAVEDAKHVDDPHWPLVTAVATIWPHSPESHQADLAKKAAPQPPLEDV
jgi:hypothetical protein